MDTTRRRVLLGLSISGIIGIAGCSGIGGDSQEGDIQDSDGDGVIDSEDYAPSDPDVQEKSDIQSGGDSTEEDTPTPTEEDTPTPTEEDTPTETETPSGAAKKEAAVESYSSGMDDESTADENWNDGRSFFKDDNYTAAAEQFGDAKSFYEQAKSHFEQAAETVSNIGGYQGAENIARESVKWANNAAKQAEVSKEAMEIAADNGEDSQEFDNKINELERLDSKSEQYDLGTLKEFKTALEYSS